MVSISIDRQTDSRCAGRMKSCIARRIKSRSLKSMLRHRGHDATAAPRQSTWRRYLPAASLARGYLRVLLGGVLLQR